MSTLSALATEKVIHVAQISPLVEEELEQTFLRGPESKTDTELVYQLSLTFLAPTIPTFLYIQVKQVLQGLDVLPEELPFMDDSEYPKARFISGISTLFSWLLRKNLPTEVKINSTVFIVSDKEESYVDT